QEPSARRAVKTAKSIHHRALAGAARAHDGDKFARLDGQRNAADGVNLHLAADVRFAEVFKLNDGGGHFGRFQMWDCESLLLTDVDRRQKSDRMDLELEASRQWL